MAVFDRPFVTAELASPVDGKDRLIASRMLTSEPLVVVATNTLDATLATWRAQTKFFVAVAVLSAEKIADDFDARLLHLLLD